MIEQIGRLFPDRETSATVIRGPLRGTRFHANFRHRPHFFLGRYEPALVSVLSRVLRPGMVGWDVGANIGYISLVMANLVGPSGDVEAFEPSPHAFATLTRNVASQLHVHNVALADCQGREPFSDFDYDLVAKLGDHSSSFNDARVSDVNVTTGDALVESGVPAPQVIKLDVEGAEMRVLMGMASLLESVSALVVELHSSLLVTEVCETLSARSFRSELISTAMPTQMLFSHPDR